MHIVAALSLVLSYTCFTVLSCLCSFLCIFPKFLITCIIYKSNWYVHLSPYMCMYMEKYKMASVVYEGIKILAEFEGLTSYEV